MRVELELNRPESWDYQDGLSSSFLQRPCSGTEPEKCVGLVAAFSSSSLVVRTSALNHFPRRHAPTVKGDNNDGWRFWAVARRTVRSAVVVVQPDLLSPFSSQVPQHDSRQWRNKQRDQQLCSLLSPFSSQAVCAICNSRASERIGHCQSPFK